MESIAKEKENIKMFSQIEDITPTKAREYLSHNIENNRNIRLHTVESYARDMANNQWELTHEGIAFDEDGNLVDGQHRLMAVIKADVPVKMLVTYNMPLSAVMAIDKGIKRSYNDSAKMMGVTDVALLNPSFFSMMRNILRFEMGYSVVTDADILKFYSAFKPEVYAVIRSAGPNIWPLDGCIRAAYLAAVIAGVDEEAIYAFNHCFANGRVIGDYNSTAATMLKTQFVDARVKHRSITRAGKYYGTQNAIYYFLKEKGYRRGETPRFNIKDKVMAAMKGDNDE